MKCVTQIPLGIERTVMRGCSQVKVFLAVRLSPTALLCQTVVAIRTLFSVTFILPHTALTMLSIFLLV